LKIKRSQRVDQVEDLKIWDSTRILILEESRGLLTRV
jgi:hypothetical protein